ncbi:protein OCTOPUS-like [Cicer arietinum]|uniref:Protein OCTOPUS-like n=1 Tax=Cicer arietinum TaxID=3827 RepID=A0A1S2Y7T6_CICAR|nr:protein OCTOPUS-like [Cicer arietinum]
MTSKTRRLTTCHRHPSKPITGFCASCLTERLAGIESSSSQPELRRTKSCSGSAVADQPSSAAVEPRRRSCEILAAPEQQRNTLSDLFNIDDDTKTRKKKQTPNRNLEIDPRNSGFEARDFDGGDTIIRVLVEDEEEETKTMKEFIDLELRSRKNEERDSRGSFWDAASVFSKRLRKWKRKQKLKRNRTACDGSVTGNGVGLTRMEDEKQRSRNLRETQSEVGEYGLSLGRRSCDTDPRLSVDDSRFSFDAPRASWDGYLIGKSCSKFSPMVAINGDRVLVEEDEEEDEEEEVMNLECCGGNGGEHYPGGSADTKHYYSDRRGRSFGRSNSRRKSSVIGDVDELRVISNAKVSPATTELFYGAKVLITEKDLIDANLKSMNNVNVQSDCTIGSASKEACDVEIRSDQKGLNKFHKWGKLWNKLGLVHRKKEDKLREEECVAGDVVNKPIAESWQKLRRVVNGQGSESVSQKLIRSYSVSCRNHHSRMAGLVNGLGGSETKGNVLNGRQEFTLQRNRSVRYSSSNVDTGLLRFYLTPLKSYRRSRSGKSSSKDLNPTARSFL